jgi:peptidoglycan/LPS O-acetylase OafA/YrhL
MAAAPPAVARPPGRLRTYFAMPRAATAIAELDGIRALAILLVLLRHGVRPFWPDETQLFPAFGWDVGIPLINGWIGVDLFFVLSGFLIAHHICGRYRRHDGRIDLGDYLVRRALRIVPAYYAVLLIAAAGLIPAYDVDTRYLGVRIGYHLLFLQDYLPANILVTFWSLGVEEKFYLLSPLLLMLVFRLRQPARQYAAIAGLAVLPTLFRWLTLAATGGPLDYAAFFEEFRSPFHMSFDGLAVGVLCALLYRDRAKFAWANSRRIPAALFWSGTATLLALLMAVPLLDEIGLFDTVFLQTVLAASGGAMLLGLVLGSGPGAWFRARWMLVLSRLAYCLYLVHYALMPGASALLEAMPGFATLSAGAQFLLVLPIYLVLSLAAALALHYAVELPFLRLRDRRGAVPQPVSTPA